VPLYGGDTGWGQSHCAWGRFHHPFGNPDWPVTEEYAWRRKFVERTITALCTPVRQPTVFEVEEAVAV
jgi:hypothetical protein